MYTVLCYLSEILNSSSTDYRRRAAATAFELILHSDITEPCTLYIGDSNEMYRVMRLKKRNMKRGLCHGAIVATDKEALMFLQRT